MYIDSKSKSYQWYCAFCLGVHYTQAINLFQKFGAATISEQNSLLNVTYCSGKFFLPQGSPPVVTLLNAIVIEVK